MDEKIITMISPDGRRIVIETQGFKGGACKKATAGLEAALGIVTSDTPTEEALTNEQINDNFNLA